MNQSLLERICNTPGVPGYEDEAQEVVAELLRPHCDEIRRDRLGNVIALRRATRPAGKGRPPRAVLAAHVDEIGMMVKHVGSDGYIRFAPMGGLNAQVVVSQRVVIHGRQPVLGVVVPDMRPDRGDKVTPLNELLIDTGLRKEELGDLVAVGDVITFAQEVGRLNGKVWAGRNFDDRLGTYCMVEAMARLGDTAADVYAVSSVQEEVGVRGMPAAAFAIEPDLGLAIDGSLTSGAYTGAADMPCALGEGAGIYLMDGLTIGDRRLLQFLFALCERKEIPYQRNIGGGTDASAIQRSRAGALTTTVGAPVRYMHSTVQLCHEDDVEATIRLLAAFLEHAHEVAAGLASKGSDPVV